MRLYFRSIFAEKLLFVKLRIGDGYGCSGRFTAAQLRY